MPLNQMKRSAFGILAALLLPLHAKAYKLNQQTTNFKTGSFYFYWGYNRDHFSTSDIRFHGPDYNFTLHHVVARDRQSKLGVDPYLEIDQLTIPQYNYRLGYCYKGHYNISVGFDHMKYVMVQDQVVKVDGYIHKSGTVYDGDYVNKDVQMKGDFLEFEHTDGLNYINAQVSRIDNICGLGKNIRINIEWGLGTGVLYPRTRAVLLGRNVNDQWHVSGYGVSMHSGCQIAFFRNLFLQGEIKGGYINMPNIVVTGKAEDRAKQHFNFVQTNVVLGYRFTL